MLTSEIVPTSASRIPMPSLDVVKSDASIHGLKASCHFFPDKMKKKEKKKKNATIARPAIFGKGFVAVFRAKIRNRSAVLSLAVFALRR